ncbi:MAG: hypothetical protein QMB64_02190, partial [Pseudomonadales bacterium]
MPTSLRTLPNPAKRWMNMMLAIALTALLASSTLFIETAIANDTSTEKAEFAANEAKLSKLLNELESIKKRLSRDLNRHNSINKS